MRRRRKQLAGSWYSSGNVDKSLYPFGWGGQRKVAAGRQCSRILPSEGPSAQSWNGQPHEVYPVSGWHSEFYIPGRMCNM